MAELIPLSKLFNIELRFGFARIPNLGLARRHDKDMSEEGALTVVPDRCICFQLQQFIAFRTLVS